MLFVVKVKSLNFVAADGVGVYPVTQYSYAGDEGGTKKLEQGHICKIMTGAPVPQGATAVIPIEWTNLVKSSSSGEELEVEIRKPAVEGNYIRQIGDDVSADEVVLKAGERIDEVGGEIGVLTSIGVTKVRVYGRPKVGILSTGNEVVENCPLKPGKTYDANRPSLKSAVLAAGFEVVDLGIVPDR